MREGDQWIICGLMGVEALTDCAEAICEIWPDAVVEDTAAGEFAHAVDALIPTDESELCVYRNLDVARQWQRGGTSRQVHNSMIQVSLGSRGVRLIADDWRDAALREVTVLLSSLAPTGSRGPWESKEPNRTPPPPGRAPVRGRRWSE